MINRLKELLFPSPINDLNALKDFIFQQSSRTASELVINYAQKRLGKYHYNFSRDNQQYTEEIMHCQAYLHAWLIADFRVLLTRYANLNESLSCSASESLASHLEELNDYFMSTAPASLNNQEIKPQWHTETHQLSQLAKSTGRKLFKLLPLTEHMGQSDELIFHGQLRYTYANFLQSLSKRIKPQQLHTLLQ